MHIFLIYSIGSFDFVNLIIRWETSLVIGEISQVGPPPSILFFYFILDENKFCKLSLKEHHKYVVDSFSDLYNITS